MNIDNTKIGVTLYNVRDFCKTPDELDSTLKKISDIGYKAIQVSGVALDPQIIKEKADKYDLYICASHESMDNIRNDFNGIVDKLKLWNCDFTAIGSPGTYFTLDPDSAGILIKEMDEMGRKFASEGIRLGYHNHHFEFSKAGDSLFIERLFDETDPSTFHAEIDVHWIQRGGQNPIDWINRVAGRMPVCHFKDFSIVEKLPCFSEIGEGNLDWKRIIEACEKTGVRWYVVEQDDPFQERSIFESLEISYKNLIKMGVK